MRWVTRRAIIGAALGFGLVATLGFVSCHQPRPAPPMPATSSSPSSSSTSPPTRPAAPPPVSSAAPDPATALAAAVAEAKGCTAPTSMIVNQPDGVVFVNAWHRKDAGNIDRLQGIVGVLAGQTDVFRCCFDLWTAKQPGHQGTLVLQMELEADGAVKSASIDATRTDVDQAVTRACVVDVAKSLTYPASPSNNATLVEYPFVVQSSASGAAQDGAP